MELFAPIYVENYSYTHRSLYRMSFSCGPGKQVENIMFRFVSIISNVNCDIMCTSIISSVLPFFVKMTHFLLCVCYIVQDKLTEKEVS